MDTFIGQGHRSEPASSTGGKQVRSKVYRAVLAALVILGGLLWANPAMASDPPYTDGNLYAEPGGVVGTAYTSGWNKGTIKIETHLYLDGTSKGSTSNTCSSSTKCSMNPSPLVACGCPGNWQLNIDAYGPKTNGTTHDYTTKYVTASLVRGQLRLKVTSESHTKM